MFSVCDIVVGVFIWLCCRMCESGILFVLLLKWKKCSMDVFVSF